MSRCITHQNAFHLSNFCYVYIYFLDSYILDQSHSFTSQMFQSVLYSRMIARQLPPFWILVLKNIPVADQFNRARKIYKRCSIVYGRSSVRSISNTERHLNFDSQISKCTVTQFIRQNILYSHG